MKILALETSAKAVSAALTEDGKVLASGYQDTGLTHSRTLMPIVEHLFQNTGMTLADCDAVAVAAGPGSFTGIRIGVAAAKGLAFALDKPVVGVSTLEAMARNVAFADGTVCEFCGDIGMLVGGANEEELCEVEIELKSGDADTASAFAEELMERFDLQEEHRSKFARASALARREARG